MFPAKGFCSPDFPEQRRLKRALAPTLISTESRTFNADDRHYVQMRAKEIQICVGYEGTIRENGENHFLHLRDGFDNILAHHRLAAGELCITTTHLSRIVRSISGRTVADYINQMLIMEAMWMLQDTSMSLSEIAEHLHFADQSSFSKFFSRLRGMPPGEYRKQNTRKFAISGENN